MSFIHHEPCPSCGSRDNLGRYADGSSWCFGCHYYEPADGRKFNPTTKEYKSKEYSDPPADLSLDFSSQCWEWLKQYDIPLEELLMRQVRWSASKNQLVFVLNDGIWQARNFSESAKSRYFTQGNVNDHLPIYYCSNGNSGGSTSALCLVEDCISAIKCARQVDSMPLLGSNIGHTKLARIKRYYSEVVFWLDADKYREAQKLAARGNLLGLSTKVVYTELDPKCYSEKEIQNALC